MHSEGSNKPTRCALRMSSSTGPAHCSLGHLQCSFMQCETRSECPIPHATPLHSMSWRTFQTVAGASVPSPGGGLCGCITVYVTCPLLGGSGDNSGMVSSDLQLVESVLIFCCDGGKRTEIEVPRGWDSSFCPLKTMWPQPRQNRWISVSSSGKCG